MTMANQKALHGHCSNEYCNAQAGAVIFSGLLDNSPEVDAMTRPECLKRAAECNRLAEATSESLTLSCAPSPGMGVMLSGSLDTLRDNVTALSLSQAAQG